jgi:hypothetical protein
MASGLVALCVSGAMEASRRSGVQLSPRRRGRDGLPGSVRRPAEKLYRWWRSRPRKRSGRYRPDGLANTNGRPARSGGIGRTASRTRLAERLSRAAATGTTLSPAAPRRCGFARVHRLDRRLAVRRGPPLRSSQLAGRSPAHPTSTARSVRSSSQSIRSSASVRKATRRRDRLLGLAATARSRRPVMTA